jgi:hypothetical protein
MEKPYMPETEMQWLLRKNIEEISQNFRTVWDLYLKFYTVFLTFNIVAMAWLFGDKGRIQEGKPLYFMVTVFAIQCILTGITSGMVANYSKDTEAMLSVAQERLLTYAKETTIGPLEYSGGLPISLGQWGGWANCSSSILLMVAWIGLAVIAKKPLP